MNYLYSLLAYYLLIISFEAHASLIGPKPKACGKILVNSVELTTLNPKKSNASINFCILFDSRSGIVTVSTPEYSFNATGYMDKGDGGKLIGNIRTIWTYRMAEILAANAQELKLSSFSNIVLGQMPNTIFFMYDPENSRNDQKFRVWTSAVFLQSNFSNIELENRIDFVTPIIAHAFEKNEWELNIVFSN